MINLKKAVLPLFAALAITAMAFAGSSFTGSPKKETKSVVTKYFRFIGNSTSDYYNAGAWEESDIPFPDCGDTEMTCTVSSTSLSDKGSLVAYLNNSGGAPRNPQVNSTDNVTYHIESQRSAF